MAGPALDVALTGCSSSGRGADRADGGEQVALRAALAALTVSGLLVRRTAPGLSATWIAIGLAVESLVTESPDQLAVLLAVVISAFSVAAWAPLRDALMGLGLLALGISLTIAVDPSDELSNIAPTLLMFLVVPAAWGSCSSAGRTTSLRSHDGPTSWSRRPSRRSSPSGSGSHGSCTTSSPTP